MEVSHFLFAVFIFSLLPKNTDTCASNGVCGATPNCYGGAPGYGGGGCGRCQTMYGCGQYGCYRMRARGSRSFQPGNQRFRAAEEETGSFEESDEEPFPQQSQQQRPLTAMDNLEFASETAALIRRNPTARLNPNKAFFECCMDRQLPDACLQKCNYGTYSRDALSKMYFKQDECPMAAMAEIQFCAAQGGDHRECCMRNGITTTLAGQKCLTFCDQRPGRVTPLDMSYIPCFDRFESMKSCFYHDLTRFRRA
jgi:hypothetical protein